MNYGPIIKEIGRGAKGARALDVDQAATLFGAMLDGQVPELELGAILMALRIKGETVDELIGFKRALDARTPDICPPAGPRSVVLPSYNGARRQANLMPLLALLLSRAGVPVLIHGRHDFNDRSNPFALLAALGVPNAADPTAAAAGLHAPARIVSIALADLQPGLDRLLALRPRMGVRSSAHTLAKLIDPCPQHSLRVVAVTHPEYLQRMDDVLRGDSGCAMLMRGTEGEAYANPRRRPEMRVYAHGSVHIACTAEEGGAPPLAELPDCPGVDENARLIADMLDGRVPVPQPIHAQFQALHQLAHSA